MKGFQLKFGGTRETLIKFAQFFEVLNYTKITTAQSRQEINVFCANVLIFLVYFFKIIFKLGIIREQPWRALEMSYHYFWVL